MIKRGKSYHRLDYHIVFSTIRRENDITDEIITDIRRHMKIKAQQMEVLVHIINGFENHIHILMSIPPKYSIAEVVKNLKGYSSRMMPEIYWQQGYGAFTVDESSFDRVFNYIKNQEAHHLEQREAKTDV